VSHEISVARDFTEFPFGRYPEHGPFSGQEFRSRLLVPALKAHRKVVVDLAGARGLAPSFLEEAFGGLIREGFSLDQLVDQLEIHSDVDPSYISEVWMYVRDAARIAGR
jgi:STAS-like domain of unknown function (DUF4325)